VLPDKVGTIMHALQNDDREWDQRKLALANHHWRIGRVTFVS